MKYLAIMIFSIGILFSCVTSKNSSSPEKNEGKDLNEIESTSTIMDLTVQLSRLPGVVVSGNREAASFQIRGANTISSSTSPLFIVNGQAFQDYPTVYRMITPANFKSARVLKNASETSLYGARGSNGVIVIQTK